MKSFGMLKMSMIVVGLGAVAMLSPACRAQEVSPDHFTEIGVQDVYESAPAKVVAPRANQKPATVQARARQSNAPASLQLAGKRTPVPPAQHGTQAIVDKRKPAPTSPNKQ
jgi:hypothetical protein